MTLLITVNTTGAWCSAAGKKNKFVSYPKSGRSDFGLLIISGILAVIVVLLEYRTLRNFEINCNHCKGNKKQHPHANRVCLNL